MLYRLILFVQYIYHIQVSITQYRYETLKKLISGFTPI